MSEEKLGPEQVNVLRESLGGSPFPLDLEKLPSRRFQHKVWDHDFVFFTEGKVNSYINGFVPHYWSSRLEQQNDAQLVDLDLATVLNGLATGEWIELPPEPTEPPSEVVRLRAELAKVEKERDGFSRLLKELRIRLMGGP